MAWTKDPGTALITTPEPSVTHEQVVANLGVGDTLISAKFTDSMEKAEAFLATVESLLSQMNDIADDFDPGQSAIPLWATPIVNSMRLFTPPERPNIDFDLPGAPSVPTLQAVSLPDNTVEIPLENLRDPGHIIDVASILFDRSAMTAVRAKVLEILAGATGVDEDTENAMWTREEERAQDVLNDALAKVKDNWASDGFPMPDGILAGALNLVNVEYMHKRLDMSRDIAIKNFELMVKQIEVALQVGIQVDSEEAKILLQLYDLEIRAALALIEYAKTLAEISRLLADLTIKYNTALVERYRAQLEGWEAEIKAITSRADLLIKGYVGAGEVFKFQIEGAAAVASVDVKAQESGMILMLEQAKFYLAQAQHNANILQAVAAMRMEAAKGSATVAAQMAAGLFAGVSASVHHQSSASIQESTSRGIDYQESHSYPEVSE